VFCICYTFVASGISLFKLYFRSFSYKLQTLYCTFVFVNKHFLAVCEPKLMSALPKSWMCGHSLAGIAGSIHAGGMDVCQLLVLCVVW